MKHLFYAILSYTHVATGLDSAPTKPQTTLLQRVERMFDRIDRWQTVARERRQLASLSDHMLKDIGLSRADVEQEVGRPFWDEKGIRR